MMCCYIIHLRAFKKMLEQKGVVIPTELLHNFFHFVLFV